MAQLIKFDGNSENDELELSTLNSHLQKDRRWVSDKDTVLDSFPKYLELVEVLVVRTVHAARLTWYGWIEGALSFEELSGELIWNTFLVIHNVEFRCQHYSTRFLC